MRVPDPLMAGMRPTIALSEWRIAVDLVATRKIRRQTGHPAENCACEDCTVWRAVGPSAFPPELAEQLRRLGIEKDKPTDLYVFDRGDRIVDFRVMFHVVGRILSGPPAWLDDNDENRMHNYHAVQSEPTRILLRVCTARDSFEYAPTSVNTPANQVLCVEFRLQVNT